MKKRKRFLIENLCPLFRRIVKVKKTTTFILLVAVMVSMSSYSQNTKLNLQYVGISLQNLFQEIEAQTDYRFAFSSSKLDPNQKVTINAKKKTLEEVLDQTLPEGITYKLIDRYVVITDAGETKASAVRQQKSISGTVTDNIGQPLLGVTVVIKGTTKGYVTDMDGNYSIPNIPNGATLLFSYIGMLTLEIVVGDQTTIDITLLDDAFGLNEVVVTALGITKRKKTLTYSTQTVDADELSLTRDISLGNTLAGKIAGVSITSSTGASGVSGDPRIIIRGNRSIQGNNQPLIVVDGIPYSSDGGGLSSINPDDVESMNVLKGPAASALYGSSANNGVIVITTKRGKIGVPRIEVNSVTNFDLPYLYPEFQNEYAQGSGGLYQPNASYSSWGPRMTGQSVQSWTGENIALNPQPNNIKDFFTTGYNLTTSVSYSTGSEKSTSYFSYSNTTAQGVLEDNKMTRHLFNLRLTAELVKNLNMDFKMSYFMQNLKDRPTSGDVLFSPMWQLVKMPRSMRTADIQNGSYINDSYEQKQNTWSPGSTDNINPYWAMQGYENPIKNNTLSSFLKLRYDFSDHVYLQLRGGMNVRNNDSEIKTYWDTQYINSGTGDYVTSFDKAISLNSDVLLVFNKELNEDFKVGLTLGAEIKDAQQRGQQATAGGLTTENKFALAFASNVRTTDYEKRIQKQSIYEMGQLSFRDYLFLDVTARNDWSSTLPKPHDYFYPSIGLSGIISDMFKLPKAVTFVKLRGSYAEVGNDASFASILQTFSSDASGPLGMISPNSTKVAENLIPEKTKSWEAGADLKFFNNRLGVDFTWYKSNTLNQLVQVTFPATSGFNNGWINAGNIQNTGIEFMIYATPVKTADLQWDFSLNFAQNKNKVVKLTESLDRYEIASPNLSLGETWLIEGKPYGEIYTVGFERNDAGQIIVDDLGKPKIMGDADLYLGNFNYDWTSGFNNSISYKNWRMSFLLDLNYGGVRQSATEAMMLSTGTSKASLVGRETGILVEGVKEDGSINDILISAEDYYRSVGGRINNGTGELFNHDATNARLREFTLGYSFPLKNSSLKSLRVSLVGRNLFFIYNGCDWFDPDVSYNVGTNGQGAESAFLPGTRTLGMNVKITL
ncbi:MAG: SusC/RagA family TonB-linked outer membrane protein [Oleispira sp.]|nr:SusC/RagA family TonB-linked outer membrane protein [Oleispira sp.]